MGGFLRSDCICTYTALDDYFDEVETDVSEFKKYPKEQHLANIRKSRRFGYTREIVFANTEICDADRYYKFALSQGGTQVILKKNPALIEKEIAAFRTAVDNYFEDKVLPIEFCYRLKLGVRL